MTWIPRDSAKIPLVQCQHRPDLINRPPHYTHGRIEPIDVIEDWKLPYHLGQVIKYVSRAAHKGHELEDLEKASWYLYRYIKKLIRARQPSSPPPAPGA